MERLSDVARPMAKSEVARDFATLCRLFAKRTRGNGISETEVRHASPRVQRIIEKTAVTAGTLGGSTWGGDVSWQQLAGEWLTLFSSRTLLGQIPFRKGAVNTQTLLEDSPGTADGWEKAAESHFAG